MSEGLTFGLLDLPMFLNVMLSLEVPISDAIVQLLEILGRLVPTLTVFVFFVIIILFLFKQYLKERRRERLEYEQRRKEEPWLED